MVTGFSGSSEVITSGLISSTFPFMTTPPREGRKALQGHAARTKDARGFCPQLRPRFLLPQPRATSKQRLLRRGKEREGGVSN